MNRRIISKKIISLLLITLFICSIFIIDNNAFAGENQQTVRMQNTDMFLIIDTSLSMTGAADPFGRPGMGDLTRKVKKSAIEFLKDLKKGDTFTLITFDTSTRFYETIKFSSLADIEKIRPNIENLTFNGPDTFTSKMVQEVVQKVKNFDATSPLNSKVIIVMSDGLDDPPTYAKSQRLDLKDKRYAERKTSTPLYVFYLHLSPKPITQEQQRRIEALQQGRPGETRVAQVDETRNKRALEQRVQQTRSEIKKRTERSDDRSSERVLSFEEKILDFVKLNWWWLAIILVVLILLIIFLILRAKKGAPKKKTKKNMIGYIVYYDKKSNVSENKVFDLSRSRKTYVKIGTTPDADIKLRGIYGFTDIKILGEKSKKGIFELSEDDFKKIRIISQKKEGILSFDDVFEIENYSFNLKMKIPNE